MPGYPAYSRIIVLVAITLCSGVPGRASSEQLTGVPEGSSFKLSAEVTCQPQLSRSELDGAMASFSSPPQERAPAAPPQAPPTRQPTLPAAPRTATKVASVEATANRGLQDEFKRIKLQETNVDWSGWISNLADKWYYVLRMQEEATGLQFVTVRPALLQFTCFADGRVDNIALCQSSGNPIYDHLQMLALMQTAPLPPFPAGTQRTAITLVQGWESHVKEPGMNDYVPGSFGRNFPTEKVREWVTAR